MASFLALLVVLAAVGLLMRALIVDVFAQTANAASESPFERPLPRPTTPARPGAHPHRLRPDALVWNAIDDLQVRRLLSGSPDSH